MKNATAKDLMLNSEIPMETIQEYQLFRPYLLNDQQLLNRVVMAPLTRARAENTGLVPTELHAEYYAQRAGEGSAGAIITEGTWVSPQAVGWADVPGIYTEEQVRGWRLVTDAVHRKGAKIFVQLWHTGATSHPDFFGGQPPLAPSAVNPRLQSPTASGRKDTVEPRAMSTEQIKTTVKDFQRAAQHAIDAGFDGVQIQAGYVYLFNQFLNPLTNNREDEYGGSVENRARFLFEVLDALSDVMNTGRIGVKTGPITGELGQFISTDQTLPTSDYVINRLNDYKLNHLLLMSAMSDLSSTPVAHLQGDAIYRHYRKIYKGNLIANVGFDFERANRVLAEDLADLVAFGRAFIANPDLTTRFQKGLKIDQSNPASHYGGGSVGYTDYRPAA
ncbi:MULTISPECIES: alkene reductase [Paraburkholderia]|nr:MULTISPECIES: alkene reductase [Paraburkholderia]